MRFSSALFASLALAASCGTQVGEAPHRTMKTASTIAPAPAPVEPRAPPTQERGAAELEAEADALRADLVRDLSLEVRDVRVLDAMRRVPRHAFVPNATLQRAYANAPWPIGYGQTISEPSVVAIMTEALDLRPTDRVLEIGTGSGYQAAILSLLANEVFTIEIVEPLGEAARARLEGLGYSNVHVRIGDGYAGWPEHAPFDRVLVTAAPPEIPKALLDQLAVGGVLVAPVGPSTEKQRLLRYRKSGRGIRVEDLGAVEFVPMVPEK